MTHMQNPAKLKYEKKIISVLKARTLHQLTIYIDTFYLKALTALKGAT